MVPSGLLAIRQGLQTVFPTSHDPLDPLRVLFPPGNGPRRTRRAPGSPLCETFPARQGAFSIRRAPFPGRSISRGGGNNAFPGLQKAHGVLRGRFPIVPVSRGPRRLAFPGGNVPREARNGSFPVHPGIGGPGNAFDSTGKVSQGRDRRFRHEPIKPTAK